MTAQISRAIRFEHLRDPLGIGIASPRLSWQTTAEPGWTQAAYELEVERAGTITTTGRIESGEQILVPWPTEPLISRERATLRVRVFGVDGSASAWSDPSTVEAGLLNASDWTARPVSAAWDEDTDSDRRPSTVRSEFSITAPVARARLYVSAHGLQETEINGTRVGDDILSPGWTVYGSRLRYYTHDVTDLLLEGANAIGAFLSDGWYRGRIGFNGGARNLYGDDLSLIAQLEIEFTDGTRQTVATDASWQASFGPILFSGLYDGESYDATQEQPGWSSPNFQGTGWTPVVVGERDPATLVAPEGPPVRCTEELLPTSVERTADGRYLLDFGQNLVGRLSIRVNGPSGTTVTLRHAEVMQDGELYTRPLRQAAATDTFVLSGDGPPEWEPRFTLHGFRYAEVSGWPGDLTTGDVIAKVYHSDMERTGWFETSNPLVNRLHDNVLWSMRGNFVDIPTDCPQRDERLGWTGDLQVFAPTASFLYDVTGMLGSWLKDVAVEQLDDGTVPWYVPVVPGGNHWTPIQPGAVWGDVAVLTPWTLFERFGDAQILETQYESAKAWVELIDRLAGPDHLWNEGFQLGDWLDPAAPPHDPADALTDRYLVATAYFAHSTRRLADTARILGRETDADRFGKLADGIRQSFIGAYLEPSGRMTSDAQTAYALAISFGLLPDDERATAAKRRLAELVTEAGNRIATGFAGTPAISDALTIGGALETAYALLLERECPSWLYTVLQGGTTIWERWDSLLPDGTVNAGEMTSFNHYALGAVADWMHRVVGGLAAAEPGYRRARIQPRPGGDLTSASATHLTPYGELSSSWSIVDGVFVLDVTVPTGTSAVVILPDGSEYEVSSGSHRFSCAESSAATQTAIMGG
ncbi:glycoside hydrolase family 78 protein [Mycetocola zhadangensis]|uniref:alpha-L-rhamnosidase n=1 Tax=Mycetocola zhadangensis TaxID=1164595 RepID=A0A3L7J1S1_9MICO|nr:glycoside hydrolase family 78 protein [Mycetocola zhadangensis]RLQ84508.1 alpha-L-rhamnosidase [Mycetocola zhadangensis]GGE92365.1 alpha-L-rhamnosidase [Mycetocola zhadangensis]